MKACCQSGTTQLSTIVLPDVNHSVAEQKRAANHGSGSVVVTLYYEQNAYSFVEAVDERFMCNSLLWKQVLCSLLTELAVKTTICGKLPLLLLPV